MVKKILASIVLFTVGFVICFKGIHWGLRIGLSIILGAIFFPIEVVNLILAHRKSKSDIERNPS